MALFPETALTKISILVRENLVVRRKAKDIREEENLPLYLGRCERLIHIESVYRLDGAVWLVATYVKRQAVSKPLDNAVVRRFGGTGRWWALPSWDSRSPGVPVKQ